MSNDNKSQDFVNGHSVNSMNSVYDTEDDWPDPIPLVAGFADEFPVDAIPTVARGFIQQLAEFTQTPVDLAAGMWMAATGVCVQKRFVVQPVEGWNEPLSLYFMGLMEPANRKSAVVSEIAGPIRRWEAEQRDIIGPAMRAASSAAEVRSKQRAKLVERMAIAQDDSDRQDLMTQLTQLDEEIAANPVPIEPRLLADDITPENLATKMWENHGRMGVLGAEGDLFDIMAGRYSKSPNFGVFLKGHSGDELRVDRGSRPSELIKSAALSLGICVQPEVLRELIGKRTFRGRGLLGRFLYSIPQSSLGRRKISPAAIDPYERNKYERLMNDLLRLESTQDEHGDWNAIPIRLSPDASDQFTQFREQIESRIGEFGDLATISDWAGKLPGAVARIAGMFHIVENVNTFQIPDAVSRETMQSAIKIGGYFMLSPVENGGAFRGKIWMKMAAHMRAVR